jgi:hypothetical protein
VKLGGKPKDPYPTRRVTGEGKAAVPALGRFHSGNKRVVFGHWARRRLVLRSQCIGLDTGGVHGGKLSACIAEEERAVQVEGWRRHG